MHLLRLSLSVVCLLVGLGGACTGARGETSRLAAMTFGPRETGGNGPYWAAAQDERGVLYLGCEILVAFDGERWSQHPVPGSYGVRGIAPAAGGRLWICAMNEMGYFDRSATGALTPYRSLVPQLPSNHPPLGEIWHVFALGSGAVFVGSDAVFVWDGTRFHIHSLPGARRLPAMQIDGTVYVSHLPTGLWQVDRNELKLLPDSAALRGNAALWMERTGDGWLLATQGGFRRWSGDRLVEFAPEASEFIRHNVLTAVVRLNGDLLCVATLHGGLLLLDRAGKVEMRLGQDDGLQSSAVMFLARDRDQGVWIGSGLGVSRMVLTGASTAFDRQHGLYGQPCNSVTRFAGEIVVATDAGVFASVSSDDAPGRFSPVLPLSGSYYDVLGTERALYAAGYKGVYRLQDAAAVNVYTTKSDVIVLRRSHQRPGTFLLADENDVVRFAPEAPPAAQSTRIARLPDGALEIAESDNGTIWVGTRSRGVFRIRPEAGGVAEPYASPAGWSPAGRALVTRLGATMAVCAESGIVLVNDDGGSLPLEGVPHAVPIAVSNPASDGSVWIAYHSPFRDGTRTPLVGRLAPTGGAIGRFLPFPVDGLRQIGGVNALHVDDDGLLWIGGPSGLLRFDPARSHPSAPPHAPVVQASMAPQALLPHDSDSVAFEFGAVEFSRREAVRFQTRLTHQLEWSPPTDSSRLALAGLRDGEYQFSVRTLSDAGLASPPVSWQFTVLPPWYRTKLAYAGWLMLAVLGFIGSVQWRSAYLRRQNARLEALVLKKTAQLEHANAAKSEFLANMSHEIRNPISGIVGLSLAMEETLLNDRQRELTGSIRSCAGLLATLVDDVLDFSAIEAGRIELRLARRSMGAGLDQCVAMVAEDARKCGSVIALRIAADVPGRLSGDAARVQQIVLNYLTNAVKFGQGRPIAVEADVAPAERIRISVRDQGPGMTAEEATKLFTKFTRLEHARTHNIRGTGLGLAVCRVLAEKMGGTVGVTSAPGEGSTFWVELPLIAAAEIRVVTAAMPPPDIRALIVEDIDYNATAMQAVLRKLGIESDIAADGPSALHCLTTTAYDVAFMDWNLPGMIGTEVVKRYRQIEPPNRRTIIIATTAYSGAFNREACLEAGMDAFISKPFTPEKIAAALGDLRQSLRAAASVVVGTTVAETEAEPAAEPEIDLQMLRFLADGTPEGLAVQIDRYLQAFEADRERAHTAIAHGDPKEIHRVAHRLVSHASAVKYAPLTTLAAELQAQSATADPGRLSGLAASFDAEFARFRSKLDSIRSSTAPA